MELRGTTVLITGDEMTGLPYVALRYFNVYGPRMDVFGKYTEVLIRWLDCLDRAEPLKIFGNGQTTMGIVFSEDIARTNLLAAKSDVADEVFNVASGTETSLLELLTTLLQVTGSTGLQPQFLPERKVNPVARRLADTHKAEQLLGFRAQVGLAVVDPRTFNLDPAQRSIKAQGAGLFSSRDYS